MTSPRTLICGSLAFDTIMVFPDRFARHILPEQVHLLSVSFTVGDMRREWGGCAGNIAYNLKAIGGEPVVMATIGDDGLPYRERLVAQAVATDGLRTMPGTFTAQAFIINDLDDNQITAFHPGAMNFSHQNASRTSSTSRWASSPPTAATACSGTSPGSPTPACRSSSIPGQGMPLFSGDDLIEMIDAADLPRRQRLRGPAPVRTHRPVAGRHRPTRRRGGRDAGRRRLAHPRRRRGDRDPRRASRSARRPHGLRRRLPRRHPVRHRARLGLGAHRAPRGSPRRAQDRPSRRAEPPRRPGRRRGDLPPGVRRVSLW